MPDLKVTQLTPTIGAEVEGLDLSTHMNQELCDRLYLLLMEHQVIFLRNQLISAEQQVALASSFGELDRPHPIYPVVDDEPAITVLEFGPENPPNVDVWHTDLSYRNDTPFAAVLYSKLVPPYGGDTMWASLTAAYDALPGDLKQEVEGRRAIHDMGDFRNDFTVGEPDGDADALVDAHSNFGSAIHPMVKVHPATGKRILYFNPCFVAQVVGDSTIRSRRLLNYLYDHVIQPEFQVRFRWTENALAIWDNRCTMHYALADYLPYQRVMHRVTVNSDRRTESLDA